MHLLSRLYSIHTYTHTDCIAKEVFSKPISIYNYKTVLTYRQNQEQILLLVHPLGGTPRSPAPEALEEHWLLQQNHLHLRLQGTQDRSHAVVSPLLVATSSGNGKMNSRAPTIKHERKLSCPHWQLYTKSNENNTSHKVMSTCTWPWTSCRTKFDLLIFYMLSTRMALPEINPPSMNSVWWK